MLNKILNLLTDILRILFPVKIIHEKSEGKKDVPQPSVIIDVVSSVITPSKEEVVKQPIIVEHIEVSKPYEILTFFELKYADKSEYPAILNRKISKYFILREAMLFDDGKQLNSVYELSKNEQIFNNIIKQAKKLDEVREFYNKPVRVTSWLRTHEWNKQVGGKSNSQHLLGTATDFIINNISPTQIRKDWDIKWSGGLGTYGRFTHMDSRPYKSRWNG